MHKCVRHNHNASILRLQAVLLAIALFVLALSSCSGKHAAVTQTGRQSFASTEAMAELLAMEPPSGVDPVVFGRLRDELARLLTLRAGGKLTSAAPLNAGCQVRDLAYDAGTGELTWSYANTGDYNIDGIVGVSDITPIAANFGALTRDGIGNDELESWIDGDGNGIIGIGDVTPLAMGFGSEVNAYNVTCSDALDSAYAAIGAVGFGDRDNGAVPPKFTYSELSLPTLGSYCEVQPVDHLNANGVESLPLNLATGHTIIANGTIGSSGGSVGTDTVIVEVPGGAFSADTQVSLGNAPTGQDNDAISGGYYIDGLPDTFTSPLTIRIKLTGSPVEGSETLLAFEEGGVMVYGSNAAPGRATHYFTGIIQDGWFIATIPATLDDLGTSSLRSTSAETDKTVYMTVVTHQYYLNSNSGRFIVYFPGADEVLASTTADAMDDAYTKIEALGLSWARRTTWPLQVTILIRGEDSYDGLMVTSRFWGVNGATININTTKMTSDDISKATAGHELMHVMQYLYDKRTRLSSSLSGGGWVWMDDACSTWFEKQMVTGNSFVPGTASDNCGFFQDALATDTSEHGYGASLFLTDLANRQGSSIIGTITKKKWDNYAPIDAVKSASANLVEFDWSYFCESFLKCSVYGANTYPTPSTVNSNIWLSQPFGDYSTVINVGWGNAADLSARVLQIPFNPMQWESTDTLEVTLSGDDPDTAPADTSYVISTYANSTWTNVATVSDHKYTITGLEDVAINGGMIFIMVVNERAQSPYMGTRPDAINIKVAYKEDYLARIRKNHAIYVSFECDATGNDDDTNTWASFFWGQGTMHVLTWDGTGFSADYSDPEWNAHVEGTVDPLAKAVTLTYTMHYQSSTDTSNSDRSFTIAGYPVQDTSFAYPDIIGAATGPICGSYITDISLTGYQYQTPPSDYNYWLSNFDYTDASLTIQFSPSLP
jgi:hypothetical protein